MSATASGVDRQEARQRRGVQQSTAAEPEVVKSARHDVVDGSVST
jgi:hypothetical protein